MDISVDEYRTEVVSTVNNVMGCMEQLRVSSVAWKVSFIESKGDPFGWSDNIGPALLTYNYEHLRMK